MSKLLMGALVVLSVGVFSSCKDYDDEINEHKTQISALQSQVDALQQAKTDLENKLTAANSAISAAETAIKTCEDNLTKAKTDLQKAISDGDEAAIAKARELADAAEASAKQYAKEVAVQEANAAAAAAKLEIIEELNKQVKTLNDAINANKLISDQRYAEIMDMIENTLASKDYVNDALRPILADIAAMQGTLATKADKSVVEAIDARLNEIYADYAKGTDLEKLQTAVALLDSRITAAVNKNTDDIAANALAIAALQQTIDQIKVNYATIEYVDGKIQEVNDRLTEEIDKLATKEALQKVLLDLTNAINNKADQSALDQAVATINETIATLATKSELQGVQDIVTTLQATLFELKNTSATKDELTAAQNKLQGQIDGIVLDINNLKDALRVLEEVKIADLNNKLTQHITTSTQQYNSLLSQIQDLAQGNLDKDQAIENLTNTMTGISNDMRSLNGRVGTIESQLTQMATELSNLANELGGLNFNPETEEGAQSRALKVGATVADGIAALKTLLNTMSERITDIYGYLNNMQLDIDYITILATKSLTSLVFRPEAGMVGDKADVAYLYGFPVIRAVLLAPQKTYTFNYLADQGNGDSDEVTKSDKDDSKQFDIVAKYWLNPSQADISKYKFYFDEVAGKNQITRGNQDTEKAGVGANVIGVEEGGILKVALTLGDGANVNDAKTVGRLSGEERDSYAWITTVALQAVRNDDKVQANDTITSDYAIIVPAYYKDLVLANNIYPEVDETGAAPSADAPHIEGNREKHLRTNYNDLKVENGRGTFSYELAYNDEKAFVDLTTIDIHYNNGEPDKGVMTHKDAIDRGFTFKYTILTDAEYFTNLTEANAASFTSKESEKIAVAKNENTSVGKVANVRVELQADGKTFAYGYISIIITSPNVDVDLKLADLTIKCPEPVATGLKYSEVKKAIEDSIGVEGALENYTWDGALTDLNKFNSKKQADDKKGTISIDEENDTFTWSFTEAEIEEVFYDEKLQPKPTKYTTYLHLTPNAGHPELAEVVVKVTIENEIYPTGEFAYTQRIQQYWFEQYSTKIAQTAETRKEIHGNVEVVGQVVDGLQANDRFTFNIASSFLNEKVDEGGLYASKDAILIYNTKGFGYSDLATVYFDASQYYVYKAEDEGKDINALDAPATSFATGVSGTKYLLFLEDRDGKILWAVKENLNIASAQEIVVLTNTYNNVATFQGWKYFDGNNKEKYAYAYDLLNKNDHNEVLENQTFTTHMMLDQRDYCFPIDFTANDAFKFDIRYLRPISADVTEPEDVYDAEDGGTTISLAALAKFIDWRDQEFSAYNRLNYINYYGIRAIKPNLDKATTNINGNNDWRNIKFFPGLQFEDLTTEGSGYYSSSNDFISQLGVIKYTNNGLNVGDFSIDLPITLLYDWGETSEQHLIINIVKTKGQDINARQTR